MRPTFVLGLGCQKGGTSWLYDYLADAPDYASGYRKEYHVFDCADLPGEQKRRDNLLGHAATELEKARRGEAFDAARVHWASMYGDHELYFDYFAGLVAGRDGVRATGDLTPAYGMLSGERVAEIRRRFDERGVRAVGVFLMRDPVERVWSQARMHARMGVKRGGATPEEVVADYYTDPRFAERTRYDRTLSVLEEVFEADERWIGFYEELFDHDRIREVCDLVGVAFRAPDFETRSNASPKGESGLSDELVKTVAEHYRGVYEAVAERFADRDLATLWPSSRFVLGRRG